MPHVKGNKFKPLKVPREEKTMVAEVPRPPKRQKVTKHVPPISLPTQLLPAPKGGGGNSHIATSNWEALKAVLNYRSKAVKRHNSSPRLTQSPDINAVRSTAKLTRMLALDCEMVGSGMDGKESILARICIVNSCGEVVFQSFVKPSSPVTDFRTRYSGVRPADLRKAPPFAQIQMHVKSILLGRIIVGHGLSNDLKALGIMHPGQNIRDTAAYPPLMNLKATGGKHKAQALRVLAETHLGLKIQEGEHHPAEDARAALHLYLKHKKDWEKWIASGDKNIVSKRKKADLTLPTTLAELAKADHLVDY